MEELIANRRSCRRYQKKNVDPALITRMLKSMAAAPTGGNCCSVEYTVIDDKDRVEEIRRIVYKIMEKNAKRHIYTDSFDDFYYARMKESEQSIRKDDMLFCGTPHLFIAHAKQTGKWGEDMKINCNLATAYFELLANSFGLGTIIMSYPAEVIEQLPTVAVIGRSCWCWRTTRRSARWRSRRASTARFTCPWKTPPRKAALVRANRYMVGSANSVICYVRHYGNSRTLLEYAQRRGIAITNLA